MKDSLSHVISWGRSRAGGSGDRFFHVRHQGWQRLFNTQAMRSLPATLRTMPRRQLAGAYNMTRLAISVIAAGATSRCRYFCVPTPWGQQGYKAVICRVDQ